MIVMEMKAYSLCIVVENGGNVVYGTKAEGRRHRFALPAVGK